MFRNVFCHQAGEGLLEDELCTEDVAGQKPPSAKACDEGDDKEEETQGPQVNSYLQVICIFGV